MSRRKEGNLSLLDGPDEGPVVYLLDVATDLEARLLEKWIRAETVSQTETIRVSSSRRGRGGDRVELTDRISAEDDVFLIPVRVVWLAPKKKGQRSVTWSDAFKPGDPRDPRGLRAC